MTILKMVFFRECDLFSQYPNLQKENIPKYYPGHEIPAHNSSMLWAGILNFKCRIFFWNLFFGDLEIWKTNHTFWRKAIFNRNVSWKCMNLNCIIILERILSNCVADCAHPMQYPMMITVAPERTFFREAHIFFSSFFTKIQKV